MYGYIRNIYWVQPPSLVTFLHAYLNWNISIAFHPCLPAHCAQLFSCVQHIASPWSVTCQASLPTEFSRPEYWSGLPFPLPGDLPDSGVELKSCALANWCFDTLPHGKTPCLPIGHQKHSSGFLFLFLIRIRLCHPPVQDTSISFHHSYNKIWSFQS